MKVSKKDPASLAKPGSPSKKDVSRRSPSKNDISAGELSEGQAPKADTSPGKVAGIIAEYNPIHDGHIYHLEKTREMSKADFVVAVMSGYFTQRGTPAVSGKWERARAAIDAGVDLVLEMPFMYACSSAEYFARGGVGVLAGLGCIDYISFGSECGDISILQKAASIFANESEDYRAALREALSEGKSFPVAREEAFASALKNSCPALKPSEKQQLLEVLREPNNILGIEYLKALELLKNGRFGGRGEGYGDDVAGSCDSVTSPYSGGAGPHGDAASPYSGDAALPGNGAGSRGGDVNPYCVDIKPITVKRKGGGHHTTASELRAEMDIDQSGFFALVRGAVLRCSLSELEQIASAGEGLGNKLKKEIRKAKDIENLIERVKSRRYTETRICRLLTQTLIGLKKQDLIGAPSLYARVLGLNEKGAELLRYIKKKESARIPVITNMNKDVFGSEDERFSAGSSLRKSIDRDILAGDLYNLAFGFDLYSNSDYVAGPYIKK